MTITTSTHNQIVRFKSVLVPLKNAKVDLLTPHWYETVKETNPLMDYALNEQEAAADQETEGTIWEKSTDLVARCIMETRTLTFFCEHFFDDLNKFMEITEKDIQKASHVCGCSTSQIEQALSQWIQTCGLMVKVCLDTQVGFNESKKDDLLTKSGDYLQQIVDKTEKGEEIRPEMISFLNIIFYILYNIIRHFEVLDEDVEDKLAEEIVKNKIIENTFRLLYALFDVFSLDSIVTALEMLSTIADLEVFPDIIDDVLDNDEVREIILDLSENIVAGIIANDDDILSRLNSFDCYASRARLLSVD